MLHRQKPHCPHFSKSNRASAINETGSFSPKNLIPTSQLPPIFVNIRESSRAPIFNNQARIQRKVLNEQCPQFSTDLLNYQTWIVCCCHLRCSPCYGNLLEGGNISSYRAPIHLCSYRPSYRTQVLPFAKRNLAGGWRQTPFLEQSTDHLLAFMA